MTTNNTQVVVGYDFSQSGHQALARAIALATRAPQHVLHFICALDAHAPIPALPTTRVDYQYAERVQQAVTDVVTVELENATVPDRVHFFVHVRIGKPSEEILALAREVGADLIFVGSKGLTGVERLVLGSVAERVVREAGCTVEVARAKSYSDVARLEIVDATEHQRYVPPHRYTYENRNVMVRPLDWPLL